MEIIHDRAQRDAVYSAGVCFGWWGIKRPDRTEKFCDDGIRDDYKRRYLAAIMRKQSCYQQQRHLGHPVLDRRESRRNRPGAVLRFFDFQCGSTGGC
jgi:hypothetical protein